MELSNLFESIHKSTGIVFTQNEDIVKRKIIRFYENKGFKDFTDFEGIVKQDKVLYQELINLITTSETYFYREYSQIELCVNHIKELSSNIKILSAPCAGGEEPFSILIALLEAGININNIDIYAIDINSDEIQSAKSGIFKQRRLYKLPKNLQDKYFQKIDNNNFKIKAELQRHIHFQQLNIFDTMPNQFNNFDIIFSRNMLIYFDDIAKLNVEQIFYSKLKRGGLLFLGHADKIENRCSFNKIVDKGTIFYQK